MPMFSGSEYCGRAVMDLVRQLTVAVLVGERCKNGLKMLVVVCRVAERSIDVSRKGNRVSERSPTVMSCPVPRVAEHECLIYTNAKAAAPAYGAIAWPTE